ncbi:MMPL family transporter [Kutzneria sp. CA-103260]|uniref:MMPL family transporter n=1 Tax=Kutzneria sp. CA-103260 TaxID=2802641 RepID=UPI001BABB21A|nr:MMPL family transporter [Kutzneria sp. CA-103260]QUQ64105.1 MMPL family transporter [Kutzneria sp. CA-103260]
MSGGTTLLNRVADFAVTRPRVVLVGAAVFLLLSVVCGYGVADQLRGLGATDPSAPSSVAARTLSADFPGSAPNLVLLVDCDRGVDAPACVADGSAVAGRLAGEASVTGVTSYWQGRSATLRSRDGRQALITARILGSELAAADQSARLAAAYDGRHGSVLVRTGGQAAVADQARRAIADDLARAELLSLPLTLAVLVLVFGSAVTALLPLAVGAIAMVGTGAVLRAVSAFADVSVFAQELSVALGLGLAIDYALFIVRRFREERPHPDAVRRAVLTAGRTVVYSAATVAVSLGALFLFPLGFLRSFAYVGVSVVLLAAVAALTVVPAALTVLGDRVDAGRLVRSSDVDGRGWTRVVIRFAPLVAILVALPLVLAALPFRDVRFGSIDDRQLSADAPARVVQQEIRDHFSGDAAGRINVLTSAPAAAVAARLATLPSVVAVTPLGRVGDTSVLAVESADDAVSPASQDLVRAIRAQHKDFPLEVAGPTAELVDAQAAVGSRLPLALACIAAATLLLVFLMTGTVLLPVKTLLLNALSLTATFGAVVWVFQDGHLSGPLGFTPVGAIDTTLPVLMFCLAFGLSMDYGLLVQSRIQEEYARTGDGREAVAVGLDRGARVVTAAAAVLVIVLVAVGTSSVLNMKMLGLGSALAIAVDATVVRCLLVPAVMVLFGRITWWSPFTREKR